jgi:hypothetical protein
VYFKSVLYNCYYASGDAFGSAANLFLAEFKSAGEESMGDTEWMRNLEESLFTESRQQCKVQKHFCFPPWC